MSKERKYFVSYSYAANNEMSGFGSIDMTTEGDFVIEDVIKLISDYKPVLGRSTIIILNFLELKEYERYSS